MKNRFVANFIAVFALVAAGFAAETQAQGRKFSVVIGSTSFAFLPIYVAHGSGFFKDEGLDVDIINVPANATPVAAILSNNADIAGLGTQAAFAAISKGQPLRIIMPVMNEYTSTIFARKDVLKQKGVSRASPLKDRVEAMKGLNLATTAIGAGVHVMYKYLFAKYGGGADVDKVARVVPIGNAAETLAGMQRGIVQVSAFSPPVAEKAVADGYAEILIDFIGGDVPDIKGSVFIVMAVSEDKLKNDAAGVRAFIRAMDRANRLAQTDLVKAGEAARAFMKNMDSALYGLGLKAIGPALPTEPTISIDGLKRYMRLLEVGGYRYNVDYEKVIANDLVKQAMAEKRKWHGDPRRGSVFPPADEGLHGAVHDRGGHRGGRRPGARSIPVAELKVVDSTPQMRGASENPFVGATYGRALRYIALHFGANEALIFGRKRWTFAEAMAEIDRAAGRLRSLGLCPGDKIGIWLPNRPEFLWYWLGAAQSGLVTVVLNTWLKSEEVAYQIGQSDSRAIIVPGDGALRDFLADVAAVRQGLPELRHVIALDPTAAPDVVDWSTPAPGGLPPASLTEDSDAPALISYSSGTTALPKGALLTHCVFRKAWDIGIRIDLTERDRLLMAIPLFGSMAMMNGVLPFWTRGAAVVLAERFDAAGFVHLAAHEHCTMTHLLPPMVLAIARLPGFDVTALASLRVAFVLSNDHEILSLVADRLRIPGVMTGYGLTESTTVATRNRWDDSREARFETQGYALPDVELQVVDPETGAPRQAGEIGEIWLRGYCIMKGYYRKSEDTAKAIDSDGWLHTGDAGVLRADGRLTFLYRLSEGYKTNGFNVAPAEIEAVVRRHPDVADVAVYGRPDPVAGHVGVACIVARPGARVDEAAVLEFLRPALASYKMPRHVVEVDSLSVTAGTGKVQKYKLRDAVEPRLPKTRLLA